MLRIDMFRDLPEKEDHRNSSVCAGSEVGASVSIDGSLMTTKADNCPAVAFNR
jgi:hypothetical protein